MNSVSDTEILKPPIVGDAPNQPSNSVFPMRQFGQTKTVKRSFNPKWFSNWRWLHYDSSQDRSFCYTCVRAKRIIRFNNSLASQTYLVVVRREWTGDEWNVLRSTSRYVFLVPSPTYIVRLSTSGWLACETSLIINSQCYLKEFSWLQNNIVAELLGRSPRPRWGSLQRSPIPPGWGGRSNPLPHPPLPDYPGHASIHWPYRFFLVPTALLLAV